MSLSENVSDVVVSVPNVSPHGVCVDCCFSVQAPSAITNRMDMIDFVCI